MNKNKFLKYKNSFLNHFKQNKKQIFKNLIWFFVICLILLAIDLIIKQVLYKPDEEILYGDPKAINWKIVAFGSYLHKGTTLFGQKLPNPVLHLFSFVVLFMSIGCCLFIKQKKYFPIVISLAAISAGAFGNMIDRMIFFGVRDIIFIPWGTSWLPGGIFNFADTTITCGAAFTLIYMLIVSLVTIIKEKNTKKTPIVEEDTTNIDFHNENSEL